MRGVGKIVQHCAVCEEPFRIKPHELARRNRLFCSTKCCGIGRRQGIVRWRPNPGQHRRFYSPEEDAIIRENYLALGVKGTLALLPRKRTRGSLKARARKIGVARIRRTWTIEENAFLEANVTALSWKKLAKHLGRSVGAVQARADILRLNRRRLEHWNAAEVAQMFGTGPDTVHRWITRKWLHAVKIDHINHNGTWQITDRSIKRFMIAHPTAFDFRRCDQYLFIDFMLKVKA